MEPCAGLSIFFKCTSTSLFTGVTFYQYQEVPDYFRQVKVPGTTAYWKACLWSFSLAKGYDPLYSSSPLASLVGFS